VIAWAKLAFIPPSGGQPNPPDLTTPASNLQAGGSPSYVGAEYNPIIDNLATPTTTTTNVQHEGVPYAKGLPISDPDILPITQLLKEITKRQTSEKIFPPEGETEIYTDIEDSEINPIGSGLKDTILGSKEIMDEDPEGETISKKPKGSNIPALKT
jgi:hypothetical protein